MLTGQLTLLNSPLGEGVSSADKNENSIPNTLKPVGHRFSDRISTFFAKLWGHRREIFVGLAMITASIAILAVDAATIFAASILCEGVPLALAYVTLGWGIGIIYVAVVDAYHEENISYRLQNVRHPDYPAGTGVENGYSSDEQLYWSSDGYSTPSNY